MIRKGVVILIILIMLQTVVVCVSSEDFQHIKEEILVPNEIDTSIISNCNKGEKIHFVVHSDDTFNCYIRKSTNKYITLENIVEESYFEDAILSREGKNKYDFIWEIPEGGTYMFYVYNPNDYNITYYSKRTDPYVEPGDPFILYIGLVILLVVVVVVIVIYKLRQKKQQQEKQQFIQKPIKSDRPSKQEKPYKEPSYFDDDSDDDLPRY